MTINRKNIITTSTNFAFIQREFIKAKKALNYERKTGIEDNKRIKGVGLEGASRTGKSWDICVFICHYVKTYQGKQINIGRDHLTTLRKTFYRTLKTVWILSGLPGSLFKKTTTEIHYNNNIIQFVGLNDDPMLSHGLESDLLIINEAMGVSKDTADQLEQRCREFFIYDYNPSAIDSWLFDLELREDYKIHKTTIFDNPYIPKNSRQKILSYAHPDSDDYHIAKRAGYSLKRWKLLKKKNIELKTADNYKWKVYGLGKRAVSEDIIFTNWELYNDEPDSNEWILLGGDFGYKIDPVALIQVTKNGKNIYLRELIYENGLLNTDIARKMHKSGLNQYLSVWDSSETKSIDELRVNNIPAVYAEKGPGSKIFGITKMQQYKIFIHSQSKNLQDEFSKYRWLKDKNGNYKKDSKNRRVPVDKNDHGIDASRYAITYYLEPEKDNEQ